MAKSKSFFGLRRGSTKSMTFQVLNGAQITKDRVSDVKNPRTRSQMVQRMIMTTAGAAYQHMREICDHSFEGVSYGQRSYSRFMQLNTKMLVDDVRGDEGQCSYNPYGDASLYPSPFHISSGSLKYNQAIATFEKYSQDIAVKLPYTATGEGDVWAHNIIKSWGIELGDILTFPFIYNIDNSRAYKFAFIRLKYRKEVDEEFDANTFQSYFEVESSLETLSIFAEDTSLVINVKSAEIISDEIYGTAILSRKSNNRWLRSNAQIIFPGATIHDPSWQEALATYPVGSDYILNGAAIKGSGIKGDTISITPVGYVQEGSDITLKCSRPLMREDFELGRVSVKLSIFGQDVISNTWLISNSDFALMVYVPGPGRISAMQASTAEFDKEEYTFRAIQNLTIIEAWLN